VTEKSYGKKGYISDLGARQKRNAPYKISYGLELQAFEVYRRLAQFDFSRSDVEVRNYLIHHFHEIIGLKSYLFALKSVNTIRP
jgi:hypothetical protein